MTSYFVYEEEFKNENFDYLLFLVWKYKKGSREDSS